MAVSITQLSNRLFLEFRFYNPHTVILLLLLPKHTLLAASPKICIRQCWVRQAELENSQSQVTPNAPPRTPGKPSNKDGRWQCSGRRWRGFRIIVGKACPSWIFNPCTNSKATFGNENLKKKIQVVLFKKKSVSILLKKKCMPKSVAYFLISKPGSEVL